VDEIRSRRHWLLVDGTCGLAGAGGGAGSCASIGCSVHTQTRDESATVV